MKFPLFAIFMTEKILNRPFQVWHMENKRVGATDVSFPRESGLQAQRPDEETKRWERRMCRSHGNLAYRRRGQTKKQKGGSDGCVVPTEI